MMLVKNLPYLPAAAQPIGFKVIKGWKMQVASTRIRGCSSLCCTNQASVGTRIDQLVHLRQVHPLKVHQLKGTS